MSEEATPKRSRVRRIAWALIWPLRHLRLFIVLFIALVAAVLLYNAWLMHRVAQVREQVQAAGGMVSIEALNVPGLNDGNNAAIPYRHANALLLRTPSVKEAETALQKLQREAQPACMPKREVSRRDQEAGVDQPMTAEEQTLLARYIQDTEKAMSFVEEAGALPFCRMGPNEYAAGQVPVVPLESGMRSLGRNISYRALYFAQVGDFAQAFHWCRAGLRLAEHAQQEPFLINGLVQAALAGLARETLRGVLTKIPSDIPVPGEILEGLAPLRRIDSWVFTIESEGLYPLMMTEQMDAGPLKFIYLRTEINMHQQIGKIVAALRAPDYAAREAILSPLRVQAEEYSGGITWDLSQIIQTSYVGSMDTHLRTVAQADQTAIAISLRAHKQATGAYPDAKDGGLDSSSILPGEALVDPFSGKPYRYQREGEGYRLWSINRDRKDDGGTWTGDSRKGDILWCMDH